MKTRELVRLLDFQPEVANFTDEQPGYFYDFGNLKLHAVQVTNQYLRPVMLFTGTRRTPRSIGSVQFELLMDVESFEQGVALIANSIGLDFTPERATPWLDQGRHLQDHLPGRRALRQYEQRPKCKVDADWFRVAAKRLRAATESSMETELFFVSFKEGMLRFDLPTGLVAVPAQGSQWKTTYRGRLTDLRHLSKRTPADGVTVSFWNSQIQIGRLTLAATDTQALGSIASWNHGEPSGEVLRGSTPLLGFPE